MTHNGAMENIELIEKAKEGQEDAFCEVLKQYTPMIHSLINVYHLDYGDYQVSREDLFQEGAIALHQACNVYDADSGVQFHTFAHLVVKRRIARRFYQLQRRYRYEHFSIDTAKEQTTYRNIASSAVRENPVLYYQSKENQAFMERYLKSLSKQDRMIVELRKRHYSYQEISDSLSISRKQVDNRIQSIRRKYRQLVKKEEKEDIEK